MKYCVLRLCGVFVASVLFFLCGLSFEAHAVKISPPRLVFEDGVNMQYLYIKNPSARTITYRFGWRRMAMTPDGDVVNVDNKDSPDVPLYKSADGIVRYSPRQTTLGPGQTQRITMLVRRTPDMPDGEYRSHFVVEQLPDAEDDGNDALRDGAAVGVKFLVSRAMPVYVRKGKNDVSVRVVSARLIQHPDPSKRKQIPYFVDMRVEKSGIRSVIANANVYCGDVAISPSPKLFAVYAEANSREERIPVNPALSGNACNNMRVEIVGHQDDPLRGQVLATGAVGR